MKIEYDCVLARRYPALIGLLRASRLAFLTVRAACRSRLKIDRSLKKAAKELQAAFSDK
jgi:hypothetical protein